VARVGAGEHVDAHAADGDAGRGRLDRGPAEHHLVAGHHAGGAHRRLGVEHLPGAGRRDAQVGIVEAGGLAERLGEAGHRLVGVDVHGHVERRAVVGVHSQEEFHRRRSLRSGRRW
jgi:hypothetical protein